MSNQLITELRCALERHHEWPTEMTKSQVIYAAHCLIRAIDSRAAVIEHMRQHITPTDQALAEILGTET